ncbi:MAG TPA: hypothetical protein VH475_12440, partial [Tepidisphaeraceae bacterium]
IGDRQGDGLPKWRTSFVGREREIAEIAARLLGGARVVDLVGVGGVGKTRLALQAVCAPDVATVGPTSFVPLAAVRDPALVMPAIAEAVRAPADDGGPLAGIAARLGSGNALLVLDNLERLLAAADDLARVLTVCPGVRLLVTSRVPLGLAGERVIDVAPLPLADEASDPEIVRRSPAVRLFLDRAQAVRPEVVERAASLPHIAAVCRRLEGIPLAIELAAARVGVLPPDVLCHRLDRRLPLLTTREAGVPDRLRTMRGAIAWSVDLLDDAEQALFRRLAVFAGGFSLSAAEATAAGWSSADGYPFAGGQQVYELAWEEGFGKEPPQEGDGDWHPPELPRLDLVVVDALEALVAHRLVRSVDPVAGDARFDMLETIREFGREELARTGEAFAVDHAHAAQMLVLAETAGQGLWGRDRRTWLARLEADLGNIRAALAWLATQPAPANQLALRMVDILGSFWITRGRVAEGRAAVEAALARPGGTAATRAMAGYTAGYLAVVQGDDRRATSVLEGSLRVCRAAGYGVGEARCHLFLALVAWKAGDHAAMADHLGAARALFAEWGDRVGLGTTLIVLAMVARAREAFAEAEELLAEAAVPCAEWGFGWGLASCAYYEGEVARARGDDRRAAARLQDGLRLYRDQGDPVGMAGCLSGLATLAVAHGDLERAARLFAAAGKLGEGAPAFLPPTERAGYLAAAELVRTRLGDQAFYAASGIGYAMPIEHVVAEAELVDGRTRHFDRAPTPTAVAPTAEGLGLTNAQFEVLRLLGQGRNAKEIAELRSSDYVSVRQMITRIKDRLHLTTDNELIAFAVEHGAR